MILNRVLATEINTLNKTLYNFNFVLSDKLKQDKSDEFNRTA